MDEFLCVKWDEYASRFQTDLLKFKNEAKLCDATIVCQDKFFEVHKLILSLSSEYFKVIFSHTPCKHPFIVIKDVDSTIFQYLVDFIYKGIVCIPQKSFEEFRCAATSLKIKGLISSLSENNSIPAKPKRKRSLKAKRSNSTSTTVIDNQKPLLSHEPQSLISDQCQDDGNDTFKDKNTRILQKDSINISTASDMAHEESTKDDSNCVETNSEIQDEPTSDKKEDIAIGEVFIHKPSPLKKKNPLWNMKSSDEKVANVSLLQRKASGYKKKDSKENVIHSNRKITKKCKKIETLDRKRLKCPHCLLRFVKLPLLHNHISKEHINLVDGKEDVEDRRPINMNPVVRIESNDLNLAAYENIRQSEQKIVTDEETECQSKPTINLNDDDKFGPSTSKCNSIAGQQLVKIDNEAIKCSDCDFTASSLAAMTCHRRIKHHDSSSDEDKISVSLTETKELLSSMDTDLNDSTEAKNDADSNSQPEVHSEIKIYKCKFCPYESKLKLVVATHMKLVHVDFKKGKRRSRIKVKII